MTLASNSTADRAPLSRDRVLSAAIEVADAGGISALTIRTLAQSLGVKPMSVYYYVANKDEILDGIVDLVYSEIELPVVGGQWETEIRRRSESARQVLVRHPWSIAMLQSRLRPGPFTLRHHNAVIGTLRAAGFSIALTAHAFALIDSYVFGYALSDSALPIHGPDTVAATASTMMAEFFDPAEYPHLLEFTTDHVMRPDYDFGAEFDYGLTVILAGLAAARTAEARTAAAEVHQKPGHRRKRPSQAG